MESNRVGGTPHHENVCHSEYAYAHIQTSSLKLHNTSANIWNLFDFLTGIF